MKKSVDSIHILTSVYLLIHNGVQDKLMTNSKNKTKKWKRLPIISTLQGIYSYRYLFTHIMITHIDFQDTRCFWKLCTELQVKEQLPPKEKKKTSTFIEQKLTWTFLKVWKCPVDFLIKKLCLPLHFNVPKRTNTVKNWNSVIYS